MRVCHNRALDWVADAPQATQPHAQHLIDYARSLPAQPGSAYRVRVPAPTQAPPAVRRLPPLDAWVVRAWEVDPPPGVDAIEWILLTSRPVAQAAEAHRITDWYTCRWLSEDYHQCLKTGCRVEHSQLDEGADLQRLLGFAAPIAVRLLQLRQTARQTPDMPATTVVEPFMVEVLARRQQVEAASLTAAEFWRRVAQLGGHQGRRRDGAPGWRTLWRGWRLLSDLTEGARLFRAPDTS